MQKGFFNFIQYSVATEFCFPQSNASWCEGVRAAGALRSAPVHAGLAAPGRCPGRADALPRTTALVSCFSPDAS